MKFFSNPYNIQQDQIDSPNHNSQQIQRKTTDIYKRHQSQYQFKDNLQYQQRNTYQPGNENNDFFCNNDNDILEDKMLLDDLSLLSLQTEKSNSKYQFKSPYPPPSPNQQNSNGLNKSDLNQQHSEFLQRQTLLVMNDEFYDQLNEIKQRVFTLLHQYQNNIKENLSKEKRNEIKENLQKQAEIIQKSYQQVLLKYQNHTPIQNNFLNIKEEKRQEDIKQMKKLLNEFISQFCETSQNEYQNQNQEIAYLQTQPSEYKVESSNKFNNQRYQINQTLQQNEKKSYNQINQLQSCQLINDSAQYIPSSTIKQSPRQSLQSPVKYLHSSKSTQLSDPLNKGDELNPNQVPPTARLSIQQNQNNPTILSEDSMKQNKKERINQLMSKYKSQQNTTNYPVQSQQVIKTDFINMQQCNNLNLNNQKYQQQITQQQNQNQIQLIMSQFYQCPICEVNIVESKFQDHIGKCLIQKQMQQEQFKSNIRKDLSFYSTQDLSNFLVQFEQKVKQILQSLQQSLSFHQLPLTKRILQQSIEDVKEMLKTTDLTVAKKVLKRLEESVKTLENDSAGSFNIFLYLKGVKQIMEEKDTYLEQTMMLHEISKINNDKTLWNPLKENDICSNDSSEGTQKNSFKSQKKFKPIFENITKSQSTTRSSTIPVQEVQNYNQSYKPLSPPYPTTLPTKQHQERIPALKSPSPPRIQNISSNINLSDKIYFYDIAKKTKDQLPQFHFGKKILISDLFEEVQLKGIAKEKWPSYLQDCFQEK